MKYLILAFLLMAAAASFFGTPSAQSAKVEAPANESVSLVVSELPPTEVSARAYGVFDVETGEILFSHNAEESLPIASVTKLFTAATVLETNKLEEVETVTYNDVATEGRAGKLEAGQQYKLRELLFPLLLESSNDAAAVFERNVDHINFANKVLADGSGLSSDNRATINELASEVRRVYLNEPHIFDMTRLTQYVGKYTGWVNNSPVRDLSGYRGGKHGYTHAANRTLAAVFAEPSLGGRELGYVILGSDDLRADTNSLRAVVSNSVEIQ